MLLENLTKDNYLQFAMASYTNIRCHGVEEFNEDLLLIKYIGRLLRKYRQTKEIETPRLRLTLNHIITFYNVFKVEAATRLLFFKLEPQLYSILKTFLVFLNFMPGIVHGIEGKDVKSEKIKLNQKVLEKLKAI